MDYSDQVFYGFIRGSEGLLLVRPRFDGLPNDLGGGELLPAGDSRNALPRFVVQSQCQRRCHGVTFHFILSYYAMYYKGLRDRAPTFPKRVARTSRVCTVRVPHTPVASTRPSQGECGF